MKNNLFYIFLIILAIGSLVSLILGRINNPKYEYKLGQIEFLNKNISILVEIADTPDKKTLGLSGRKNLDPKGGMLFIFNKPDYYYFWMEKMNFPIDIVWLDQNFKIVDISHNVTPESYPAEITSISPAQYILEVPAGFSKNHNIVIEDKAYFH